MAAEKEIDVEHVAKLASLTLAAGEASTLARELSAIVAYVAQLETLDTSGVEPTANVQLTSAAFREDALVPSLSHEDALSQAPRAEEDGFAVPVFVE
jgi:aspartyl-tRNA(Asn)/glutamyl-tRNA(Gln) amidotransferase subunit C